MSISVLPFLSSGLNIVVSLYVVTRSMTESAPGWLLRDKPPPLPPCGPAVLQWAGMTTACECEHIHGPADAADAADLGLDLRNGRSGQVTLHRCAACGARWLHYRVDYEAFSRLDRWFCGRVDEKTGEPISAANAIGT